MLASVGHVGLLLMLWPILLGVRLLQWAERGVAILLGVYFGLIQGGAFAAAAIAHMLLSRGGLSRLIWGAGGRRLAARAMSVPVPGTPPRRTDALRAADRLPSDALFAVGAFAPAVQQQQQAPPAEPAVPQPITPPPVAAAGSLPSEATPLLAPVAEAEQADSTAAAAAAAGFSGAGPSTPAPPVPQQAAPQPTPPPQQPAGHPTLDAALVRAIARSKAPYGPPSLEAVMDQWEADLAAQAGADSGAAGGEAPRTGPAVLKFPARRLEDLRAREEQLLAAFEPAGPEALQAAAAWLQATEPSPSMGGNGLPLPAVYATTGSQPDNNGPAAHGYQPLPQRPPDEGDKQAPTPGEPAGPDDAYPAAPVAPTASPARPPRPLPSVGSGRISRGSGRSGSALSFDRMASHPLPDLELDEEEGGSRTAGNTRTVGSLQAAATDAAAHAVHDAATGAALGSVLSGGDMDTAGLTADDSMDITRHTKREKR